MTSTVGYKRIIYTVDLICMLLALVLIAFGIFILCMYDPNEFGSIVAYAYIGIGGFAILLLLLGGCAAKKENVACTVTFIVLLYVLILVQLIAAFLLTTYYNSAASSLGNIIDKTWEEELVSPGPMSGYETKYECCGRASPQDYIVHERLPPATCFVNKDSTKPELLIPLGCRIAFENFLESILKIFNILAWVLIALEFLGSILSCCLCNSIKNDRRRSYY